MKLPMTHAAAQVRDTALNNQGLDEISKLGRDRDPAALQAVARQFEAMFLQQMLKSMRAASDVFADDNFMNSNDSRFYRDMYDQQLALTMSAGKGVGIADSFYRQMLDAYSQSVDQPNEQPDAQSKKQPVVDQLSAVQDRMAPAASSATATARASTSLDQVNSPAEFAASIRPYAYWAASVLKVDPQAIMAQAALETGWGKHVLRDEQGENSFNLFNIKAGKQWSGERLSVNTTEYTDGQAYQEEADFRRYPSLFSAFQDYVQLLQQPRYKEALAAGDDAAAFAHELQRAGYATDPEYANKIIAITDAAAIRQNSADHTMQVARATVEGGQG